MTTNDTNLLGLWAKRRLALGHGYGQRCHGSQREPPHPLAATSSRAISYQSIRKQTQRAIDDLYGCRIASNQSGLGVHGVTRPTILRSLSDCAWTPIGISGQE